MILFEKIEKTIVEVKDTIVKTAGEIKDAIIVTANEVKETASKVWDAITFWN